MNETARRMLERAALILEKAHFLQGKAAWSLVVRRAQEVVELALEAALMWAGLEKGTRHFNVRVRSAVLGVSGIIDLVIDNGTDAVPVEVKITEHALHLTHRIQLHAYAMLLAESWARDVPYGLVYLSPRRNVVRVTLDEEARMHVMAVIESVRATVMSEQIAVPTVHRERCIGCEYQNFCGDVW